MLGVRVGGMIGLAEFLSVGDFGQGIARCAARPGDVGAVAEGQHFSGGRHPLGEPGGGEAQVDERGQVPRPERSRRRRQRRLQNFH